MWAKTWDWVAHYAMTQPDATALHNLDGGETRTWRELDFRVGRIARYLLDGLRLPPGSRITNLSDGDLRHFELQFACIRAGMVWVPFNFRQTPAELAALARNLAPALMLTDAKWAATAQQVVAQSGDTPVAIWGKGSEFDARIDALAPISASERTIDPDATMQVLFTSGTTGRPKAVAYTLNTLTWQVLNQLQYCATQDALSHVFVPLPLFHAGGLHAIANPVLFAGGMVTVSARFVPDETARFVGNPANRVTHLSLVPVMFQMIADSPAFAAADFSAARLFLCAGGRLTQSLIDAYDAKGVRFITQYGGTETGPTITSMNPARVDKIVAGSCGQKAMFVDVRLVDDTGRDVGDGEPGEVWVRGPAVTTGYIIDGALEPRDEWLRTGDVAIRDEEGFYFIVDRVKDMYKSGGENVFPAEVEHVLADHPAVGEIAVIGVADDRWGEVGLAIAVVRSGHQLTIDDLRAHCDGRLGKYKQPQHLVTVDALPRNVTGKISKPELRARFGGSRSA